MARNKQAQKQKKDGQHRKETKEERRARLKSQQEAREYCEKLLPLAGGIILLLVIVFGVYVHSVPPREAVPSTPPGTQTRTTPDTTQMPPTTTIPPGQKFTVAEDNPPMIQEALDEAKEMLDNIKREEGISDDEL